MGNGKFDKYMSIINESIERHEGKNKNTYVSLEELKQNKEIIEKYQEYISDDFCELGLNDDSEPNSYGLLMEDIIDFLNHLLYELEEE